MARTVVWDAQKWRALYSRAERHALTAQEVSSQQSQSHASAAYGSGLLTSFASAPSVTRLAAYELDDLTILATALWLLAIATAALGVMLVVVGKLRLASLAQYLPVPVVGGYLAYIGFYCGQAGLAMMAGVELTSLRHWNQLLTTHALLRVAPGFAVALAIKLAGGLAARRRLPRIQRALIVPLVLSLTVALFYAVQLGVLGKTLEDARQDGWVGKIPARLDLSRPHHKGGGAWREVPALRPWTLYFPRSPGAARRDPASSTQTIFRTSRWCFESVVETVSGFGTIESVSGEPQDTCSSALELFETSESGILETSRSSRGWKRRRDPARARQTRAGRAADVGGHGARGGLLLVAGRGGHRDGARAASRLRPRAQDGRLRQLAEWRARRLLGLLHLLADHHQHALQSGQPRLGPRRVRGRARARQ